VTASASGLGRATGRQSAAERITVALTPQAGASLHQLQDRTGQGKTDIVNRAITLYEFIEAQVSSGRELIVRNQATGETQLIRFL
jgi:hypothetical protein